MIIININNSIKSLAVLLLNYNKKQANKQTNKQMEQLK